MKTIALYGGSFDPPHLGHEAVVKALLDLQEIDKVLLMPTFLNPFKLGSFAPASLRLKWLRDIFVDFRDVIIDSFEVEKEVKVATIESVSYLLKSYDKVYLVIGADNLESLHLWHKFEELSKKVTFIVASRDEILIPDEFLQLSIDKKISSSEFRKELSEEMLVRINAKEIVKYYKENNER